jgi:hypothetical protein
MLRLLFHMGAFTILESSSIVCETGSDFDEKTLEEWRFTAGSLIGLVF